MVINRDIKKAIIIGSGRSIADYKKPILDFISKGKLTTVGINNMVSLCTPKYHLWTNRKQFSLMHKCIQDSSVLLLGCNIPKKLIKKHKYTTVDYVDKDGVQTGFKDGKIYGFFRTAGVLAIMISHLMGAKEIYVVGMDGFTLYPKKELLSKKKSQHCYKSGYTDDADWKSCKKKDEQVYGSLRALSRYGIKFSIITPTVFKEFYKDLL